MLVSSPAGKPSCSLLVPSCASRAPCKHQCWKKWVQTRCKVCVGPLCPHPVLTLLLQTFGNHCHGRRAPWSKEAFALTQSGCLCALVAAVGGCVAYVSQRVSPLGWSSLLVRKKWLHVCARGDRTLLESRVCSERGKAQLLALRGLTASRRVKKLPPDTVFHPLLWYEESCSQAICSKLEENVKLQHGKGESGIDVTKRAPFTMCSVCSLPKPEC